jgi:hypothetical protein
MLFGSSEMALMTDIAMVETWLTLVECDIVDGDGQPLPGRWHASGSDPQ